MSCKLPPLKSSSKGQVSMETLTLMGFALAFFIPLILLFFAVTQQRTDEAAIMQARLAGRQISDNAGEAFMQGVGSRREVLVNFPPNLVGINASGRDIVLRLENSKGAVDIVTPTFVNVTEGSTPLASRRGISGKINSGNYLMVFQPKEIVQGAKKHIIVEITYGN